MNKVNPRKEFFKIDLNYIKDFVKTNHNSTVDFTTFSKAEEYRASIDSEYLSV